MQELRLIDPYGYLVPGTVQSNVPDANAAQVTDLLLHEVAPEHAAMWDSAQHRFDVREYWVQPTRT